jgi:hypothetical protein
VFNLRDGMLVRSNLFISNNWLDIGWGNDNWMWVNRVSIERFEGFSRSEVRSGLEVEL